MRIGRIVMPCSVGRVTAYAFWRVPAYNPLRVAKHWVAEYGADRQIL